MAMQPYLYDRYDPVGALAIPVVTPRPTVGQRYNNLGNLRSNDPFIGKQGQGKGGYDIYDTPENGLRALARDLQTKSKRMNTIRELITVYAPPSDNNPTENYIDFVAREAGVEPDEAIDISALRPAIMRGIIKFENKNRDLADDQMLANAIAAADGVTTMAQPLPRNSIAYGLDPEAYRASLYRQFAGSNLSPQQIEDIVEREMQIAFPPAPRNMGSTPQPALTQEQQAVLSNVNAAINQPDNSITGQGNNNDILNFGILNAKYPERGTPVTTKPVPSSYGQGPIQPGDDQVPHVMVPAYAPNYGLGGMATDRGGVPHIQTPDVAANYGLGNMTKSSAPNYGLGNMTKTNADNYGLGLYQPYMSQPRVMTSNNAPNFTPQTQAALMDNSGGGESITTPTLINAANASTVSGRRRDQSPMSFQPSDGLGDLLMRVGLAGVRGAQYGGLEALGAMGEEYGRIQDARGSAALEMYKANLKSQGKKRDGSGASSAKGIVVNDDIDRALSLVQEDQNGFFSNLFKGDLPATGLFSVLSIAPGSDANLLKNRLQTIRANISFDKLQAMREESPTGGALGQVSTFELQNLMSVFGSLEQSQTADELEYNLRRVQKVYNDIIHGEGNHPYQMPTSGGDQAIPLPDMTLDDRTQADVDAYLNK